MGVIVKEKVKGSDEWWIFVHHNNQKKTKKIGDKETAEKVAEKIRAKLTLKDFGFIEKKKTPGPTLKELAKLWLAEPQEWRQSTRENYIFNLEKHVYPKLGKRSIDDLSRKDLKSFFNELIKSGMAPNSVAVIRAPINGVLMFAVDEEIIEFNPLQNLPRKSRKPIIRINPLDDQQAEALLIQAQTFKGGWYPVLLCALRTGIRVGEMQALKWADVDFKARVINIVQSFWRGHFNKPKNGRTRRVDITPHLAEILKSHKTDQKKAALKGGYRFSKYVFANPVGNMLNRETYRKALNRALKGAGLEKIRIHDLRHTYATIRLLRGHNIGDVSYQLGHSSIKITFDTYGHWIPGKFKNEVDDLDNSTAPNCPQTAPNIEGV